LVRDLSKMHLGGRSRRCRRMAARRTLGVPRLPGFKGWIRGLSKMHRNAHAPASRVSARRPTVGADDWPRVWPLADLRARSSTGSACTSAGEWGGKRDAARRRRRGNTETGHWRWGENSGHLRSWCVVRLSLYLTREHPVGARQTVRGRVQPGSGPGMGHRRSAPRRLGHAFRAAGDLAVRAVSRRTEVRDGCPEGSFRRDGRAGRLARPSRLRATKAEGGMSDYDSDILVWSEPQGALLRRREAGELVDDRGLDWAKIPRRSRAWAADNWARCVAPSSRPSPGTCRPRRGGLAGGARLARRGGSTSPSGDDGFRAVDAAACRYGATLCARREAAAGDDRQPAAFASAHDVPGEAG
jgi:hypothetical protein